MHRFLFLMICAGSAQQVMLIGFSADIGRRLGDTKEHCRSEPSAHL
jgi:hypothetical protein